MSSLGLKERFYDCPLGPKCHGVRGRAAFKGEFVVFVLQLMGGVQECVWCSQSSNLSGFYPLLVPRVKEDQVGSKAGWEMGQLLSEKSGEACCWFFAGSVTLGD